MRSQRELDLLESVELRQVLPDFLLGVAASFIRAQAQARRDRRGHRLDDRGRHQAGAARRCYGDEQ
jgi:hypothetical protein